MATGNDAGLDQQTHHYLKPPTTRGLIHESADRMIWHVAAADLMPPVLLTTPKRPSTLLNQILLN
ncbi:MULTISPECIES: hypothetical protein [unclassified Cyanobium]|uniref:hypothetical protein n=1 Tax=unclassified Cyanobium TaxID=2627006 RepID=UPI0020CCC083|nr:MULTISPECIES: hypothetical protein [unclassified Cyanobium]MCP9777641.1 hypothetical protein [Cyanobium sp. Tous-M-B4]